ncbi:MAG: hypothetical protein R2791_02525 [Saprospiraceae bacterium]
MENSLLWQVFVTLGSLERKHLDQWLCSPFFCRREQPLQLYRYLQTCLDKGVAPAASATGFASRELNLLMSEVLGHIEHFLVYRERFEVEENFPLNLATAYRKRGLEKHFRQRLHKARVQWAQQPYRHAEYFEAQAGIEYEWYQFLSMDRRTEALNLQDLSDQTDTAYIARKLRQACMALSHQTVYNAEYRFGLLDAVLDHVRHSERLQELPAVALYYNCYLFLTESEGEGFFQRFKEQLLAQQESLPVEEQRNLHLLAINYCIRQINRLAPGYFREALDLYQSALRAELLFENGLLSHFAYNNIVAIAIKVGEHDWVRQFIENYAQHLEKKHRNASYHLNLARVEYERRDMRAALLHLQQADYKDLINNLIAKTLQLKIYYETDEFDTLDAHLQSMQTFIRRQRVIGYHKTNYLNIIRYTRQLMQHHAAGRQVRERLRQKITSEPVLTEKEWFLEQLSGG